MIIRKAKTSDSKNIFKISKSVKINWKNPQKEGFITYPLQEGGYGKRIKLSKYFYVAEENKEVIGYLMCYDDNTLKRIISDGNINHQDGTTTFLLKQKPPYIFGDHIAIKKKYLQKGVGERLMERLSKDMKKDEIKQIPASFVKGKGCNLCAKTGYRGRTALFEVLVISEEIRKMLLINASAGDIREQAIKDGMITMKRDGMLKVAEGITSVSEVLRSVFSVS